MPGHFSRASLLALLLVPSLSAQETSFIHSLQFRGSGRRVELETHAGQTLDPARLERDVRRLWNTGWFDDIRVEASQSPEGVELVFTVVERPRLYLRRLRFEPAGERRPFTLAPGTPVDKLLAHRLAQALRQQLVEAGYADADVAAELVPVGFRQVDLLLRVERGPRYRVNAVHFSGNLGLPAEELRRALRATRARRILPRIPGLWRGWRLHPPYSENAVAADRERLRSFYLARGYFAARIAPAGLEVADTSATVSFEVDSGPPYRIARVVAAEPETLPGLPAGRAEAFPSGEFCACLFQARRAAERAGQIDFAARLEIEPQPPPATSPAGNWVALTTRTESGPAYSLGRIEFRGNHAFSDLTLRRALRVEEGERFDLARLRQSLGRLNHMGFLEPLTLQDVQVERDPARQQVNLTIHLQERPRGRWALSGPLGPLRVAGPLQFAIGARLPAWGRGALELSTYAATFNLLAFSQPVIRAFTLVPQRRFFPLFALERPLLPGQHWLSGFLLSPQLTWQGSAINYLLTHAASAAHAALQPDPKDSSVLAVPVWWHAPGSPEMDGGDPRPAGVLLCEADKPRWAWLRLAGATALDWLLLARPL